MNAKILRIKDLIKNYTIETTPKIYEKIDGLSNLLEKKTSVYITYLPEEDPIKIINTAKKIKNEGLEPIPHLPARTIENLNALESYIGNLSEIADTKQILIIGGTGIQKGPISSSLEVLHSGLLEKFRFKKVGLAGHPDGSPDISQEDLDNAIKEKNKFAKNTDAKLYLVTQFFFDVSSFIRWEKHLEYLKNDLDIHAGLPGPANLGTLINFAKSCGIGNSLRFLSKQVLNISKIASTRTPDRLISNLAEYKEVNNSSKLKKIHFYPFGGIKKTSSWASAIINNDILVNKNGSIKINNYPV